MKWIFKLSSLIRFRRRLAELLKIYNQNNNVTELVRTIEV